MHTGVWVWHFVIHVFVLITDSVVVTFVHVVMDCRVVVDESSSIQVLWLKVEPHVVPMRRINIVNWQLFVFKVFWKWKCLQL
jgi:hypothetical protein